MLKPELYNKTVDILVQAYFNDTLEHGNCYACAVGNLIAGNCGYEFGTSEDGWMYNGADVFTGIGRKVWTTNNKVDDNPVFILNEETKKDTTPLFIKHLNSTGYSIQELSEIEREFEKANPYLERQSDERMFKGLMSVIEALDKIHENNDTQITTLSKNKFIKPQPYNSIVYDKNYSIK